MKLVLLFILRAYQRLLSPDHSWQRIRFPNGWCRYYPSCSEYAVQAIQRHGSMRGSMWAVKRLVRCTPFHAGGIDTVPR